MARPPIEIDEEQVAKLAKRQWTHRSIAAFFNVSEDTIKRRFADLIQENYAAGQALLVDRGWEMIQKGSERMLIKFLENYCDFRTKHDVIQQGTITINDETQVKIQAMAEQLDQMLGELSQPVVVSLPKGLLPDNGG